ncbi:hypothetical protein ACVWWO_007441 [Bradyrhizobium sp. F1.13.1]
MDCVETTARMAGNLGFDVRVVRDATWTFDRIGPDGELHAADDVHAMSLANLNGEFRKTVRTEDVLAGLPSSSRSARLGRRTFRSAPRDFVPFTLVRALRE